MLVGIDLGTTFSAIAHLNSAGKAEIIANKEGERKTPSVVMFKDGAIIVGEQAKNNSVVDPYSVCQFVKRQIGKKAFSFDISVEQKYSAEEISALILKKIIEDAESVTGEKVEGCVITVPAYFDAAQRKATRDAGEIAGANVLGIINEPAAAALAYCHGQSNSNGIVMVYDIGGGTFDVTIMRLSDNLGKIDILATAGNRNLGGFDFDNAIISKVIDEYKKKYNLDLEDDDAACQDLRIKAERLKKSLSECPKASLSIISHGNPLEIEITREDFESMISSHVASTKAGMVTAMNEVKKKLGSDFDWKDISKVLLVGGSAKIPAIQAMIKEYTGMTPSYELNPDEAVAMGAAYYANSQDVVITEENAVPVMEKTVNNVFSNPIETNLTNESTRQNYEQNFLHDSSKLIATGDDDILPEEAITVEAKPSRKLLNGIDYDNGIFYKTEYGKNTVISYEQAFQEINNTVAKMLKLGPEKDQTHKAYYNEVLRLVRIANTNRSLLSAENLGAGLETLVDAVLDGTDTSVCNLLSQNIFYYADELFVKRRSTYDLEYFYVILRDSMFWLYQCNTPCYKEYTKAFYMVNKIDKSMPDGYFDLSYVTKENEKYLDIYYLEITDYFAKQFINMADEGIEIGCINTIKKGHDIYVDFRQTLDSTMPNYQKDKKKLTEIYNMAIGYVPERNPSDKSFIKLNPYNAGIGYAIGIALGDNKKCREAIGKLSFGKDILNTINDSGSNINNDINRIETQKNIQKSSIATAVLINIVVPLIMIGTVCYLEMTGHILIGIIVALGFMFLEEFLYPKSNHIINNPFLYQFTWSLSVALPMIFLIRRGHIVFAAIAAVLFWITYSGKKRIESYGNVYTTSYMIARSMRIILPCILIYYNHMYSVIILLALAGYFALKNS